MGHERIKVEFGLHRFKVVCRMLWKIEGIQVDAGPIGPLRKEVDYEDFEY